MTVTDGASVDSAAGQLLRDLVGIASPSGQERECARRLVEYFESHGREAYRDEVGNVRAPAGDGVLLTSHLDTVPGDIEVEVAPANHEGYDGDGSRTGDRDGSKTWDDDAPMALWGRGSVDAKGSLAAMTVASVRTGVSFAGVVGEETDSSGARHLVGDREEPDAVVNGEPSGWDAITLGYRGFTAGTCRVETPVAHTARPEPNAIELGMDWWSRVEAALESGVDAADENDTQGGSEADGSPTGAGSGDGSNRDGRPVFERATAKPVATDGATGDDGLEVAATVEFQVRIPPGMDLDGVRGTVETCLDDVLAGSQVSATGRVDWDDGSAVPPWIESPRNGVARAFRRAIRAEGGDPGMLRKTGTADSNLYGAAWDCPVVTYGPGDSALDHAPDEHLPLSSLDRAVAVLETVAEDLT